MPLPARFKIAKSLSVNASLITTPPFFSGDFTSFQVSLSTQSNAAVNIQGSNEDGFQSVIPELSWRNILTPSVQSVFAINPIPRWSRTSSPASSNATIIFVGRA